jgi:hypothetical protein
MPASGDCGAAGSEADNGKEECDDAHQDDLTARPIRGLARKRRWGRGRCFHKEKRQEFDVVLRAKNGEKRQAICTEMRHS